MNEIFVISAWPWFVQLAVALSASFSWMLLYGWGIEAEERENYRREIRRRILRP